MKRLNKDLLCTLGPASLNDRVIERLSALGVTLFRINLSHTRADAVADVVRFVQDRTDVPLCLDTEGAQIRTGRIDAGPTVLTESSFSRLAREEVPGDSAAFNLYPRDIVDRLVPGDFINIDFDSALVQVVDTGPDGVVVRVINGGRIDRNKAVSVQRPLALPAMTEKDRAAIAIGLDLGVRHFALSFASRAADVAALRDLAGADAFIIAKIENRLGFIALEEIATAADAILIDRGDLSRELPIERIPAAQKNIARRVRRIGRRLYVATNLLESMVQAPYPTRAEVNDIYNTLADGADGLVLAAETAIGRHPIECANMVVRLVHEYEQPEPPAGEEERYFLESQSMLVEPHGGALVCREVGPGLLSGNDNLARVPVGDDLLSDCEQIAVGTYSPLTGFMDRETLKSVLDTYRLPDGTVWTLPIILPVAPEIAAHLSAGQSVVLTRADGTDHSLLDISEVYEVDLPDVARRWFGTQSSDHPGVARLQRAGSHFIAGAIRLLTRLPLSYRRYELTPQQCRHVFAHKGWRHVVGFHSRNIAHRAHEYIQLAAMERTRADGLFINPVLGAKKPGDFLAEPIVRSYQVLFNLDVYPHGKAVLSSFSTYSRYSGPREAVFTALCRKNMGCDFFIIGRDHTGVGDFYPRDGNRRIFERLGNLGVAPVFFDEIGYSPSEQRYGPVDELPDLASISGSAFRRALTSGERLPDWFIRPEIQDELLAAVAAGEPVFHV